MLDRALGLALGLHRLIIARRRLSLLHALGFIQSVTVID